MNLVTTSMALPISGPTQVPIMESASVPVVPASADVEARRLAAAIAKGDEEAFRRLYDCYRQRLLRFALVLGQGDESMAQDAVQAVFVIAARKLRSVESEEHLWNWLARVARQHISKRRRQQQRGLAVVDMENLPEHRDHGGSDAVLEQSLDAALSQLEEGERQLIEEFYFERRSHKEIAEQLNLTPKAVSSRLERVREKLRSRVTRNLL
jgi:RNA polymerase sigma factor (sigma-70 family)